MAKMRCLLFVVDVLVLQIVVCAAETLDGQSQWTRKDTASAGTTMTDGRNVISPRMDFEEWTPLGRGDPLKNDPTFDYLPPVLDKVHYWKSPTSATNRAHYYSSASTATPTTQPSPQQAVHGGYNRRFFLADFSKREPAQATAYAAIKRLPPINNILQPHHHHQHNHHRPQQQQQQQQQMQHHLQTLQAVSAAGYHYSMHPAVPVPRTPLPMLTPPPYQQWPAAVDVQRQSSSSSPDVPGNVAAESKQPPPTMVRAPTRPVPLSSHHSAVVKALLDDEIDRTTVTTTGTAITAAVWTTTTTTPPPPTPPSTSTPAATRTTPPAEAATDPLFSHYRQSPVTGGPMYLIIQGHSKVKTYGPASKLDDLTAAPVVQDHNHIGNQSPDEPSRRKRDHYHGPRR